MAQPYVVRDLTVQGELQTATQVGGGLTLQGADNPIPLVVNTGAAVKNIFATPLLECLGNLHVAGTLSASLYDNVYAPSADVSGEVTCAALSTALFSSDFYVAPGGDDGSGNGSATNPFKTIQRALTQVEVTFGGGAKTIHLAPGTYTEDLFINSCVSIVSLTPNAYACKETKITGDVVVAVLRGTDDVDTNILEFNGVHFTGNFSVTVSAFPILCTYIITNCFFDFVANKEMNIIPFPNSKVYITKCYITRSTPTLTIAHLVLIDSSWIEIADNFFQIFAEEQSANGTQAIALNNSNPTRLFSNNHIQLHYQNIPNLPNTYLNCVLASATTYFRNCTFEFLVDNVPVGPPYQLVIGVLCTANNCAFSKNVFKIMFLENNSRAIFNLASTISTSADNVIYPGSASAVESGTILTMPSF
jgi:hypothetical protein